MKKQIISIAIAVVAIYSSSYAQQNENDPRSNISVVAQYKEEGNKVELRFFADKKSVLENGMQYGYSIERAEINSKITKQEDLKYQRIAEVTPFTEIQWEQAMQIADDKLKKQLEATQSFYKEGINTSKSTKPVIDLKTLLDKKNADDFEFLLLLMSAIQQPIVADALGLAYDDKTVKANTKYVYKVSMINYNGPYKIMEIPYLITTAEQSKTVKRDIEVTVGDTKLGFSWEENDMISGVMVERKNNEIGNFEPLNDKPKYSLSENSLKNGFEDINLVNYQAYEYNFYGFNAFGEKILFGNIKAMPKDLTPPKSPLMQSARHTKSDEIEIKWNILSPVDTDLNGFNILRAKKENGEFKKLNTKLLSKITKSYTDKTFIKEGENYYIVQAIDTVGNISTSFSSYVTLIDTIAPNIPKFLSSKIDSLGVVTLNIEPNKEKDLMGYRLFMANDSKHEFSAIQEDFDNDTDNPEPPKHMFNDTITLKSLSPYVYYKVKALDFHYNQSGFSEMLMVKRIDTIPPTTPVFKNVIVGETTIELHFALSESKDVREHLLYRKTDIKAEWEILTKLENTQSSFIDTKLEKRRKYFYSIRAMDESNLFSDYAMPVSGKPYDNGRREAVKNFSIRKNNKQHILSWDYKTTPETYFIIYRANKEGKLVQYKRTEKLSLIEKIGVNPHNYAIKAYTKDGGFSKISKTIATTL